MNKIEWINSFLGTKLAESILLPAIATLSAAILGGIGFLIRRRIEKRQPVLIDEFSDLHQAISLKEKLDRNQMSLAELRAFRSAVLNAPAEAAVSSASHYIGLAQRLVDTSVEAQSAELNFQNATTQGEMNAASATSALAADKALAELIESHLTAANLKEREFILSAHSAWQAWRDAEIAWMSQIYIGASMRPMVVNFRREAMTRERIASIQQGLPFSDSGEIREQRKNAPKNLLEHVVPGVLSENVRKWLGPPKAIYGKTWIYRFVEVQLQINLDDRDAVTEVVVALIEGHVYKGSGASWGAYTLGEMTLAELVSLGVSLEYRVSMRTQEVYTSVRMGPAGAWTETICGALLVDSEAGALAKVYFEWDQENKCLVSDAETTLVNWIGMSAISGEGPTLYWFIEG